VATAYSRHIEPAVAIINVIRIALPIMGNKTKIVEDFEKEKQSQELEKKKTNLENILKKKDDIMKNDLSTSIIDRKNILNNELAIQEIQKSANIDCVFYADKLYFTKEMVANFFEVEIRTIERYISSFSEELKDNGYTVLKGKILKEFLYAHSEHFGTDINVGTKTTVLGIFDFKSFLNIAMLLSESENAKILRKMMLDVVIDLVNQKTGGGTKFINQRDKDFIGAYLQEDSYRKEFTNALRDFVDMGNIKYPIYTDMIYQSIFKENSAVYREVLKLHKKDKVRDTLYAEVLDLVASYECGLAVLIEEQATLEKRKLSNWEINSIFRAFELLPHWKPLIHRARTKMASRDLALRDAFHEELNKYIKPLEAEEYKRFLGLESEQIEKLMRENEDVLKRLKNRE